MILSIIPDNYYRVYIYFFFLKTPNKRIIDFLQLNNLQMINATIFACICEMYTL
jgi:hypothetical protein